MGGQGAAVGPALDQVTLRRSENWLRKWLTEPSAVKPGTLMPEFAWSDGQFRAIYAYLSQFHTPVNAEEILAREGGATAGAGEALVEAYQCWSCHKVTDQAGRPIYPDLTTVRERRSPDWEKAWLSDPQAVKPGTFMPTFPLTDAEIDAITAYLYSP